MNYERQQQNMSISLYCFHHAGGSASSYLPWKTDMGPDIQVCPVQLPGRGSLYNEDLIIDFGVLIERLSKIFLAENSLPFAFFGHSLGGLVAFELCHFLKRQSLPMPKHLFISGTNPPIFHPPSPRRPKDDESLIERLKAYEGTDEQIFKNKEFMEMVLPVFRADLMLIESYHYQSRQQLALPLTLLTGKSDEYLQHDRLSVWGLETSSDFEHYLFEGGHFYIQSRKNAVLQLIRQKLLNIPPSLE
ncbi:MAG: lgrE [Gammaproteobacteria bacterium]|jgi:medium-chain acyl-[acyl-carrier-protein] hydrolase|nr:lgrE [Gammaproteobacteria bacterium]